MFYVCNQWSVPLKPNEVHIGVVGRAIPNAWSICLAHPATTSFHVFPNRTQLRVRTLMQYCCCGAIHDTSVDLQLFVPSSSGDCVFTCSFRSRRAAHLIALVTLVCACCVKYPTILQQYGMPGIRKQHEQPCGGLQSFSNRACFLVLMAGRQAFSETRAWYILPVFIF